MIFEHVVYFVFTQGLFLKYFVFRLLCKYFVCVSKLIKKYSRDFGLGIYLSRYESWAHYCNVEILQLQPAGRLMGSFHYVPHLATRRAVSVAGIYPATWCWTVSVDMCEMTHTTQRPVVGSQPTSCGTCERVHFNFLLAKLSGCVTLCFVKLGSHLIYS